ncbi:hypothetical protein P9112_005597 [Eukaryota sp. TZLM1-RC]
MEQKDSSEPDKLEPMSPWFDADSLNNILTEQSSVFTYRIQSNILNSSLLLILVSFLCLDFSVHTPSLTTDGGFSTMTLTPFMVYDLFNPSEHLQQLVNSSIKVIESLSFFSNNYC